ncbi:ATP-binding cassette domain-containing protein [Conexibacter sp. S30A1]|uniref:ATP-binding cassette domain-containing protein n=1 Tax=Conexibacter sp. S30A1 TaxID=2937800 RepID=UPI00200DA6F6|nr:ATP-binding cassette domain-containing protein [Conexibacter sp. S30A1]
MTVATPPHRLPELGSIASPSVYEASAISKSFAGAMALSDVSVWPGEIHTLVGENGAGKSTLLRVMAGIHQPDSGRLVINGQQIHRLTPHMTQQLGIYLVPQEPTLMPHLTFTKANYKKYDF